jgi:hypothetical protein
MKNCDIHYYLTNFVQVLGEAESIHRVWSKLDARYRTVLQRIKARKRRSVALTRERESLRDDLIRYGRLYPFTDPKADSAILQIALTLAAQKFDNHQPLKRDRYCPRWWTVTKDWVKRWRWSCFAVVCCLLVNALLIFFTRGG